MGTGGVAILIGGCPFAFRGQRALGTVFFFIDLVIFLINMAGVSSRAIYHPRVFKNSFYDHEDGIYVLCMALAFATLFVCRCFCLYSMHLFPDTAFRCPRLRCSLRRRVACSSDASCVVCVRRCRTRHRHDHGIHRERKFKATISDHPGGLSFGFREQHLLVKHIPRTEVLMTFALTAFDVGRNNRFRSCRCHAWITSNIHHRAFLHATRHGLVPVSNEVSDST